VSSKGREPALNIVFCVIQNEFSKLEALIDLENQITECF